NLASAQLDHGPGVAVTRSPSNRNGVYFGARVRWLPQGNRLRRRSETVGYFRADQPGRYLAVSALGQRLKKSIFVFQRVFLRQEPRVTGHVDPTKQAFAAFRANDRLGPIHMLNLVRFREQATYPDGREATGAEAYASYGRESHPVFSRLGGRIVWRGRFELLLIGPLEEKWDECFIAEYPSVDAFVAMIRDPVYREAVKHRQAAVLDSRLIRLDPVKTGTGFGSTT